MPRSGTTTYLEMTDRAQLRPARAADRYRRADTVGGPAAAWCCRAASCSSPEVRRGPKPTIRSAGRSPWSPATHGWPASSLLSRRYSVEAR